MKSEISSKKVLLLIIAVIIVVIVAIFLGKKGTTDQGASVLSLSTQQAPTCLATNTTPSIRIISPNGGETFTAGQQVTVKWSTCNVSSSMAVKINLLPIAFNGTVIPVPTANIFPLNTGAATFTLPTASMFSQLVYGNYYKFSISIPSLAAPTDNSDNFFTITMSGTTPASTPLLLTPVSNQAMVTVNSGGSAQNAVFTHSFKLKNTSTQTVWVNCTMVQTTVSTGTGGTSGGGPVSCTTSPSLSGGSNSWSSLTAGSEILMNRQSVFTPVAGSAHSNVRSTISKILYRTSQAGQDIPQLLQANPYFQTSWNVSTPYVSI